MTLQIKNQGQIQGPELIKIENSQLKSYRTFGTRGMYVVVGMALLVGQDALQIDIVITFELYSLSQSNLGEIRRRRRSFLDF